HAKHLVIVKIGLLYATVFQSNFSFQSSGKTKDDAAFHLGFDDVRIDGASAIDGANHAVDFNVTIFSDGSLDYLRDITFERKMCGDAATDAFRKRFAPTGFFRDKIQSGKHARLLREKLAAELVRILLSSMSDFIEKTFGREAGVGMADGAPPLNGNAD